MLIPRACVKQQELLKRSFCVCEVPNMVVHHYYCHEFPPVTCYGKAKRKKGEERMSTWFLPLLSRPNILRTSARFSSPGRSYFVGTWGESTGPETRSSLGKLCSTTY
jgi:hypothetical protein